LAQHKASFVQQWKIEEAANVKRGPKSTVHKISTKVEKGARSFANNARDRYENKQRSMAGIQKAKEHIEKAINYPIKKFLEQDKEARKKRVIQGGFRAQIWKWLSIAIKSGLVGFAVNPLAGAITAIGLATIDKSVDLKTKRQVLKELETEIKLCEEKIDDAKAEAQKQEKYKLMRIKAKLENEYERIKYNLGPK
jgi:rhamnose utilization protein RhaD (predicted bifunctional aldolase and dehydrogenase)